MYHGHMEHMEGDSLGVFEGKVIVQELAGSLGQKLALQQSRLKVIASENYRLLESKLMTTFP